MFSQKRRVEQDLERIRRANLSPEALEAEERQTRRADEIERANKEHFGFKDVLAMIIAVLSLLLPYVLIFCAVIGALVLIWLKLVS